MKNKNLVTFMHIIAFCAVGFMCAWTAAQGYWWASIWVGIPLLFLQFLWQVSAERNALPLLNFMLILAIAGTVMDTLLMHLGVVDFRTNGFLPYTSPPWMMILWLECGLFLYALFRPLWGQPFLLGFIAFIGFPALYWGLLKFSVVSLSNTEWAFVTIAVIWAFLLPTVTRFSK